MMNDGILKNLRGPMKTKTENRYWSRIRRMDLTGLSTTVSAQDLPPGSMERISSRKEKMYKRSAM